MYWQLYLTDTMDNRELFISGKVGYGYLYSNNPLINPCPVTEFKTGGVCLNSIVGRAALIIHTCSYSVKRCVYTAALV